MEEKNIKKISDEEYLKLKRSNEKKKAIIIVLVFAMIIMLVLLLLYYFNSNNVKNENTVPENESNKQQEISVKNTKFEEIELTEKNQNITINGKTVKLKYDGKLYINDIITDFDNLGTVYATDKIILIVTYNQCGFAIEFAIDDNGKIVYPKSNYKLSDYFIVGGSLEYVDGKVVGNIESFDDYFKCESKQCSNSIPVYDIEITYDGHNLNINKIN